MYHRFESGFSLLRIKCICTENLLHLTKTTRWERIIFWGDVHSIRFRTRSKIYCDLFLKLSPMLWDKIKEGVLLGNYTQQY